MKSTISNSKSLSDALTTTDSKVAAASFASTFPFFLITIVFLVASLVVAQKMGAQGATSAIAIGKRTAGRAKQVVGGATFGAAAFAGQRSAGWAANKAANSTTMQSLAAKSWAGEKALRASRVVADSSFDARRVAGLGKMTGLGEGKKGGFASRITEKEKEAQVFAKSLEKNNVDKDSDGNYSDPKVKAQVDKNIADIMNDPNSKLSKAKAKLAARTAGVNSLPAQIAAAEAVLASSSAQVSTLEGQRSLAGGADIDRLNAEIAAAQLTVAANNTKITALRASSTALTSDETKAQEEVKRAVTETATSAESMVVYAKQLAYLKRKQDEASRFKSAIGTGAATGGGAGVGAVVTASAGVALGGAALGAIFARTQGALSQSQADALLKEYGTDGTAKIKKEKDDKNLKALIEQIKETGDLNTPAPTA